MKFNIELGKAKQHQIAFEFNQLLGRLVIKYGQQEITRSVRWFNEPLKETHVLRVEGDEPLTVRIEKERRRIFGSKCLVFLNERLFRCYEGI